MGEPRGYLWHGDARQCLQAESLACIGFLKSAMSEIRTVSEISAV